jgi:hypothetical protein
MFVRLSTRKLSEKSERTPLRGQLVRAIAHKLQPVPRHDNSYRKPVTTHTTHFAR